jgi:hypothetical protein
LYIGEEQTKQWPRDKVQKDKQRQLCHITIFSLREIQWIETILVECSLLDHDHNIVNMVPINDTSCLHDHRIFPISRYKKCHIVDLSNMTHIISFNKSTLEKIEVAIEQPLPHFHFSSPKKK